MDHRQICHPNIRTYPLAEGLKLLLLSPCIYAQGVVVIVTCIHAYPHKVLLLLSHTYPHRDLKVFSLA